MLKGVIFDLDGVIVDSHPVHIKAWKRLLASAGIVANDRELDIVRDGRNKQAILRHFMGDLSEHEICRYGQEKDRLYWEEAQDLILVRGVRQLLNNLRRARIPIAVASSGSFRRVHTSLDLLRVRNYFAAVVTATEFKAGKSDSTIFLKTAQRLQVRCEESLVFEDSAAGVRSATAIGMKCLGISDAFRAKVLLDAGAERVFPHFAHMSLGQLQGLFTSPPERKDASQALSLSN